VQQLLQNNLNAYQVYISTIKYISYFKSFMSGYNLLNTEGRIIVRNNDLIRVNGFTIFIIELFRILLILLFFQEWLGSKFG